MQPSQRDRKEAEPARSPAAGYTTALYAAAVGRAVRKANAAGCRNPDLGPALPPVPHWHPNQLRHLFATSVRKGYGLEAAQVLLGHSKADVTQIYAERDLNLALTVAARVG